jgi:phage terminase large subunit-like protein
MFLLENCNLPPQQKVLIRAIQSAFPAKLFLPNRSQREFLAAVGNKSLQGKKVFLLTSANGVGKTTIGAQLVINLVYGNINFFRDILVEETGERLSSFFDAPLYSNWPGWPKNIWYISNHEAIKGIWHDHFLGWMPQKNLDYIPIEDPREEGKDGKPYISRVEWPTRKWRMTYKTIDQDPKVFESENVGVIIFDEPPPEALYNAAVSRLRAGGIIVIVGTAVIGSNAGWFLDRIVDPMREMDDVPGNLYWYQSASAWDNTIEDNGYYTLGHGMGRHPVGTLRREEVERMVILYRNTDESEARIQGQIKEMSGRVIKNYRKAVHWVEPVEEMFKRNFMYRMVVDPHDRRFPFVLWLRMGENGQQRVIREWPSMDDDIASGRRYVDIPDAGHWIFADFVRMWVEIEKEIGIPRDRISRIIDPNYGRKIMRESGELVHEHLSKVARELNYPMPFVTNANNDLKVGHAAIRDLLNLRNGRPGLVIDNVCHNTDLALRRYSWAEHTGKDATERRGLSDKPMEKYKDPIDCLRYNAVIPWVYKSLPQRLPTAVHRDYEPVESVERPKGAI